MTSGLITLVVQALFLVGIVAAVGGCLLTVVELFRERGHFFKHHPTNDCPTC